MLLAFAMLPPDPLPPLRRRQLLAAACGLSLAARSHATAPPLIRHSMAEPDASEPPYRLQVLRLLLDRTVARHGPYGLQADTADVTQTRNLAQLKSGAIDVWASMLSRSREQAGISIPICLRRGINGVRLPIVLARRRAEFEQLRHVQALRTCRFGQVSHWPDVRALTANGFTVEGIHSLDTFAAMLRLQRFDVFLLAADEAHAIVDTYPDLVVLDDWAIAYPSIYGFFVSPLQPALAERLREGWRACLADGSFAALFEARLGPGVQRARLDRRRWFCLPNPDLPDSASLRQRALWHPLVWQKLLAQLPH